MKRVIGFLFVMLISSVSFGVETINLVVNTAANGTNSDHRGFFVILKTSTGSTDVVPLIPMTKQVLGSLQNLSDGKHTCEGTRYKGQVFDLANCN